MRGGGGELGWLEKSLLKCSRVPSIDWVFLLTQGPALGSVVDVVKVPKRLQAAWSAVVASGELEGVLVRSWLYTYSTAGRRACLVAAGDQIEQLLSHVDDAAKEIGWWLGACSSAAPDSCHLYYLAAHTSLCNSDWVACIVPSPPPCPYPLHVLLWHPIVESGSFPWSFVPPMCHNSWCVVCDGSSVFRALPFAPWLLYRP